MRTLFAALLVATTTITLAQGPTFINEETLALRIVQAITQDLGQGSGGLWQIHCRVVQHNSSASGTGSSLVMYTAPRVYLGVEMELIQPSTGDIVAVHQLNAQGRTSLEEAVDHIVDRATLYIRTIEAPSLVPELVRGN